MTDSERKAIEARALGIWIEPDKQNSQAVAETEGQASEPLRKRPGRVRKSPEQLEVIEPGISSKTAA